jgi:sugar phosphate isomerase/epimerase
MAKKKIPIALQLYSVRKECEKDLPAVLAAVAKMGYDGVEFAGYYNRSAADLKKMVGDLGLKVAGAHVGLNTLQGDELPKSIDFHRTLGNKYLVVPWIPEELRKTLDDWKKIAEQFNAIADKLKSAKMQTGYHNHNIEFTGEPGKTPWDVFFQNTKKEVICQMDTGNCIHGNADPLKFMEPFPGRLTTVHLKEFSKTNDKALIGEGDVKWSDVFRVCESAGGTKWYIVEQESYAYPPLECVDRCLKKLREMGK